MIIIDTDVQEDIIFRKIGTYWFELRINFDNSKVENLHWIGFLDIMNGLDQGWNMEVF